MKPEVSVVTAVYNGQAYLRETIDSILAQTMPNFEYVIVNDASTDATAQILASYTDPRLHVITNPHNRGPAYSRNRGLQAARAALVAIIDGDDIAHPTRLAQQLAYMQSHPDVVLLGAAKRDIDANGQPLPPPTFSTFVTSATANRWFVMFFCPFVHSAVMYRREPVVQLGGYDEAFPVAQDYDLWLRLAPAYRLENLPDVLVQYRHSGGSLSARSHRRFMPNLNHSRAAAIRAILAYPELPAQWLSLFPQNYSGWAIPRPAAALAMVQQMYTRFCELHPDAADNPEVQQIYAYLLSQIAHTGVCYDRQASLRAWQLAWQVAPQAARQLDPIKYAANLIGIAPVYRKLRGVGT